MYPQDTIPEEWRDIPGWEGLYAASTLGQIRRYNRDRRVRPWKLLKPQRQWHGYRLVGLSRNHVAHSYAVHKLVALTFLGPCPDGHEVDHRDNDKANNRPDNLEYVTRRENLARADRLGLTRRGVLNGLAKLTEDDVRAIRISTESQNALARHYNVSQGVINNVRLRKTWKHVL